MDRAKRSNVKGIPKHNNNTFHLKPEILCDTDEDIRIFFCVITCAAGNMTQDFSSSVSFLAVRIETRNLPSLAC